MKKDRNTFLKSKNEQWRIHVDYFNRWFYVAVDTAMLPLVPHLLPLATAICRKTTDMK